MPSAETALKAFRPATKVTRGMTNYFIILTQTEEMFKLGSNSSVIVSSCPIGALQASSTCACRFHNRARETMSAKMKADDISAKTGFRQLTHYTLYAEHHMAVANCHCHGTAPNDYHLNICHS